MGKSLHAPSCTGAYQGTEEVLWAVRRTRSTKGQLGKSKTVSSVVLEATRGLETRACLRLSEVKGNLRREGESERSFRIGGPHRGRIYLRYLSC